MPSPLFVLIVGKGNISVFGSVSKVPWQKGTLMCKVLEMAEFCRWLISVPCTCPFPVITPLVFVSPV